MRVPLNARCAVTCFGETHDMLHLASLKPPLIARWGTCVMIVVLVGALGFQLRPEPEPDVQSFWVNQMNSCKTSVQTRIRAASVLGAWRSSKTPETVQALKMAAQHGEDAALRQAAVLALRREKQEFSFLRRIRDEDPDSSVREMAGLVLSDCILDAGQEDGGSEQETQANQKRGHY